MGSYRVQSVQSFGRTGASERTERRREERSSSDYLSKGQS